MVDKGRALCYPALELSHSSTEGNVVSKQSVIGIDLGGTKIRTALVDRAGGIISHDYRETRAAEGPQAVIRRKTVEMRRRVVVKTL